MNATPVFEDRRTYLAGAERLAEFTNFAAALAAHLSSRSAPEAPARLQIVDAEGNATEIPPEVYEALVQVTEALSSGRGVTVVPTDSQLTTQQAAEHLGISRPTLIKLLEQGRIPFSKVGRHRRILLKDLVAYEASARAERRRALDELSADSMEDGSYFATLEIDHRTR
ncbi:helix-turn-helix domain-containing protein [Pseudarthrobacter sp. H2]|uniref:helix-turn-helix domain-containing protein n=1 Tax=Pseudarthrobacter sp. H2 TaxID=3418415 RepID=UPI003CF86F1F